jgi:hypothetical protein
MATHRFTGRNQPPQGRRGSRISWILGLILFGAVSWPAASASGRMGTVAARHSGADPVCCIPDDRGPKKFSALIVTGKVSDGAIASMTVGSTNSVGLVVTRHVRGNLVGVVGVVPLGLQRAGLHKVPWNLHAGGSPLAAGTYDVLLEVLDNQGHPSGLLPARRYALLTISSGGRDTVHMKSLR